MPKMTLLDIVQDILNDMDSDEVNSINDTIEAEQVAQIVKTTYNELMDGRDWPHLNQLVQLEASGTTSKPTHMKLPENMQYMNWVKYNKRKVSDNKDKYSDIRYKDPKDFMDYINQRNSNDSTVQVVTDFSSVKLLINNDAAPTFWTSFDNDYIVFDSFDSVVDSTLQSSKVQTEGHRDAIFTISDTFIPDLPANVFSYLLSESKSVAFNSIKQVANPKEEQRARRQSYRMSGDKWRVAGGIKFQRFGRKTARTRSYQ